MVKIALKKLIDLQLSCLPYFKLSSDFGSLASFISITVTKLNIQIQGISKPHRWVVGW